MSSCDVHVKTCKVENIVLSKCLIVGSLFDKADITSTTADMASTHLFCHYWSHTMHAITIGISFLMAICCSTVVPSHCHCSHWSTQMEMAPRPQFPEASEYNVKSGEASLSTTNIMQRLSQTWRKALHQPMSALNSAFKWIQWSIYLILVAKLIIRPKNSRPTRITLQAWDSFPISNRSTLFRQNQYSSHCSNAVAGSSALSSGSLVSILTESSTIPRNVIVVVRLSTFSALRGNPSVSQVFAILFKWDWH